MRNLDTQTLVTQQVSKTQPPLLRIKEARVKIEKVDKVTLSGLSTDHCQKVGSNHNRNL